MVTTHIIHLAASTARDTLVADLIRDLPGGQVLPASDGRKMSAEDRTKVAKGHLLAPRYPFGLMPSEIGCFLSHRAAWQAIAAADAPFGLVAEDDVATLPGFSDALALALEHGTENSLIRFPMRDREQPDKIIAQRQHLCLFRPKEIGLTAALYLLGRTAARQLVQRSAEFDRPVDTWLQMRWVTGVDSLTLWPSHITSAALSHGGSTIQKKRSAWGEVARAWRRARYRAAITKGSKTS